MIDEIPVTEDIVTLAQLDFGRFLFHEFLDDKFWNDLDESEKIKLVERIIERYQEEIPNDERKVEFCLTRDSENTIQLMALPKADYDAYLTSTKNA